MELHLLKKFQLQSCSKTKKIQTALKELEAVSHKGSYQEWLSKNKSMLGELKIKNPIAYTTFMEDFQIHKTNLQTKGVI